MTFERMKTIDNKIRADCFLRANAVVLNNRERWCAGTEYPSRGILVIQKRCERCSLWIGNRKPKEKEQQCVKPFHKCNGSEYTLIEDSHFDFCPYCGKPIDWNEGDPE